MASGAKEETERTPLLPPAESAPQGGSGPSAGFASMWPSKDVEAPPAEFSKKQKDDGPRVGVWERVSKLWSGSRPVVDSMTYRSNILTSWTALFPIDGVKTAFDSPSAWQMLYRLLALSCCVGVAALLVVPNPAGMRTSKFQKIAVFLRVFVGLLLGFFLSLAVNRWFECSKGFLELYDAIRNLQMQLLSLGVKRELVAQVVRYSVVSGWLLGTTLAVEARHAEREESEEEKSREVRDMYEKLRESAQAPSSDAQPRFCVLTDQEINTLKGVADPAAVMWIWIASLVSRMSQDGWLPPMQAPTYGFVMKTVTEAHTAIRNIRQSVWVQAPFTYVHLLAVLVHVNNIVNAVSFGIVLGSTMGTALQYSEFEHMAYEKKADTGDVLADCENVLISFVICVVGPFLYHLLLEVSISIGQPFAHEENQVPTDRMLERLQKDLQDAADMADAVPSWEVPFFKEAPSKSGAVVPPKSSV